MIVVTAELHSARTGKVTLLGRATIANDRLRTIGTGGTFGDYNCHFTDKAGRPWKECRVESFRENACTCGTCCIGPCTQ